MSSLSFAQGGQVDFKSLISGQAAPSTMKLSALTDDYKAVRLKVSGDSGGFMGGLGMIMMMSSPGQSRGSGQPGMEIFGLLELSWTKGDQMYLGGTNYYVTYKTELGAIRGGTGPSMGVSLRLTLVRADTISSIQPQPDVTKEQVIQSLKAANIPFDQDVVPVNTDTNSETTATAAVLYPVFAQAKEAAMHTATLSNAKQIALTLIMYANDYDDVLPFAQSTGTVQRVTRPYSKNDEIWKTKNPKGGQFRFNMALSGVAETEIPEPASTVLVYESEAWADGRRAVAFADGHAKLVSAQDWTSLEKTLKLKLKRKGKPIKE